MKVLVEFIVENTDKKLALEAVRNHCKLIIDPEVISGFEIKGDAMFARVLYTRYIEPTCAPFKVGEVYECVPFLLGYNLKLPEAFLSGTTHLYFRADEVEIISSDVGIPVDNDTKQST